MKKPYMIDRPLADMHGDGVRFNQQLKNGQKSTFKTPQKTKKTRNLNSLSH